MAALITVAETPEYVRSAGGLLSDAERMDVMGYLAANPRAERNDLAELVRVLKATAERRH